MECQLARVLEDEQISDKYRGWYLWVEVGAPTMECSAHFETEIPLTPCLQYQIPYHYHGMTMVAPADCIELLPVSADVQERPFEEWLQTGGEPPPQDIA